MPVTARGEAPRRRARRRRQVDRKSWRISSIGNPTATHRLDTRAAAPYRSMSAAVCNYPQLIVALRNQR